MNSIGKEKFARSILSAACCTALGAGSALAGGVVDSGSGTQKTTPSVKSSAQVALPKPPAAAAASTQATPNPNAMRAALLHLKRGQNFSTAVEPEMAIEEFNTALKLVPGLPEALLGRGMAYVDLDKYTSALADLEAVASTPNPVMAEALIKAGTVNFKVKNYTAAIADFDKFGKASHQDLLASTYMAECYLCMNKPDLALKEINLAYKLAGTNPLHQTGCKRVRAKIYCALGQYDKALDDYTAAETYLVKHHDSGEVLLSCNLMRSDVLLERAKVYDHLGKKDLAQKDRDELHSEGSFFFKNMPFRVK